MTKKDYAIIASTIARLPAGCNRVKVTAEFCKSLIADNSNFKPELFIMYCLPELDLKDVDAQLAEILHTGDLADGSS